MVCENDDRIPDYRGQGMLPDDLKLQDLMASLGADEALKKKILHVFKKIIKRYQGTLDGLKEYDDSGKLKGYKRINREVVSGYPQDSKGDKGNNKEGGNVKRKSGDEKGGRVEGGGGIPPEDELLLEAKCLIEALISKIDSIDEKQTFGRERSKGELKSIIDNIYQNIFGQELYPTNKDKASALLYFMIKKHPFWDGNKRISSVLFVYFLDKHIHLKHKIPDDDLLRLSIYVAESNYEEHKKILSEIKDFINRYND